MARRLGTPTVSTPRVPWVEERALTISHHLVRWTARSKARRLQRRDPGRRYRVLPVHNAIWRWRVVSCPLGTTTYTRAPY